jgi:hypothetical protein
MDSNSPLPAFDIEAQRLSLGKLRFHVFPTAKSDAVFLARRLGLFGYIFYQWIVFMIFLSMIPQWLFSQMMPLKEARPYALITTFAIVAIVNILDYFNHQRLFRMTGVSIYEKGVVLAHLSIHLSAFRFDDIREVKSGKTMGTIGKFFLSDAYEMDLARLIIVLKNGKKIKLNFFTHLYNPEGIESILAELTSELP